MTDSPWQGCLDRFADHLARQRKLLAAGLLGDITAFVPETGLPPLPNHLLKQAKDLQTETDALVEELRVAQNGIRAALSQPPRSADARRPAFTDCRI